MACRVPFNAISIHVGTASVNTTTTTRALFVTNAAGSTFSTAVTNPFVLTGAAAELAATAATIANEALVVFAPPADWGKVQAGGYVGVPEGFYAVNVRATLAPTTTAAVANAISIYWLALLTENILDNGTMEWESSATSLFFPEGDGLVALFDTANPQNRVTALVRAASG